VVRSHHGSPFVSSTRAARQPPPAGRRWEPAPEPGKPASRVTLASSLFASRHLLEASGRLMGGAEQSMRDAAAKEEGQAIRINPPYHRSDAERWLRGHAIAGRRVGAVYPEGCALRGKASRRRSPALNNGSAARKSGRTRNASEESRKGSDGEWFFSLRGGFAGCGTANAPPETHSTPASKSRELPQTTDMIRGKHV
jgi:hypothetical protein